MRFAKRNLRPGLAGERHLADPMLFVPHLLSKPWLRYGTSRV